MELEGGGELGADVESGEGKGGVHAGEVFEHGFAMQEAGAGRQVEAAGGGGAVVADELEQQVGAGKLDDPAGAAGERGFDHLRRSGGRQGQAKADQGHGFFAEFADLQLAGAGTGLPMHLLGAVSGLMIANAVQLVALATLQAGCIGAGAALQLGL